MEDNAPASIRSVRSEQDEWKKWLESDCWKLPPKWTRISEKKTGIWDKIENIPAKIYEFLVVRISYEDYFASQLRGRYIDLKGNYGTSSLLGNENPAISELIKEFLILSRRILEKDKLTKIDLISASSLLDEAEERMVWIMPTDVKISRIHELNLDLGRFSPEIRKYYENLLKKCESTLGACYLNLDNLKDNEELHKQQDDISPIGNNCNAFVEEVVRAINKDILAKRINKGLQIERLRSLRFWGLILLLCFILLYPMTSLFDVWVPYQKTIGYFNTAFEAGNLPWLNEYKNLIPIIGAWAVALTFCIIGGIGGFLSGLLQVRSTETNLELYEEAVLLFQIRPIFGGFTALITFMLISLGAFNSVFSDNPGTYAIAAFLSGFSERYFLRLLNTQTEPTSKEMEKKETDKKVTEKKETKEKEKSDRLD